MRRQLAVKEKRRFQFEFARGIIAELKKVAWPSRQEAIRLTLIVLVVTVVIAITLGMIDYGFSKFVDFILLK